MSEKVLVIGSGPIVIGQAAEFDYSGTQGCLALREEGYHVILVNNNPATIMTDYKIADTVYCEPLTTESLTAIIKKDKPDALLAGLGGQTALNLAVELEKSGVLELYGVDLLGTSVRSIQQAEDRELFRDLMGELGQSVPESEVITSVKGAVEFADKVGYPVISRPAYTLGGRGGGIVHDKERLMDLVADGIKASPIQQVMVEKSIAGFKEIEYEMMRDANGTCIAVCNMENFDPVGVHTGDSIVVAPSQTLTDQEYHMLRSAAIKIVSALEVIGGCNVQLALDPHSKQYYVIEVNPRVSRSSALASKATGYPIAKMAAKLALGIPLDQLLNPLTGHTYASFEPALDYVVVKFPRWPFDKFREADRKLGTKMKATGEVMAIDRTLEGAFQKAVQSLDTSIPVIDDPLYHVNEPTDLRYFAILELFRKGQTVEFIHEQTHIDRFFLTILEHLVQMERSIQHYTLETIPEDVIRQAKWFGFSDASIAQLLGVEENQATDKRKSLSILPGYKMVDTCAAEFKAQTNYVYSTYTGMNEIEPLFANKKALVIGSGPIRIGQGVEFDYSAVKAIEALKDSGWTTLMLNNNPETVSTDYETADRLYFEPIHKEVIQSIVEHEQVDVVFTQFGGQTALNMVEDLEQGGIPLAGIEADVLDALEDREKFYGVLDELNIPRVNGSLCHSKEEAFQAAETYTYPLICRPSYVIGGQGMVKVHNSQELEEALEGSEKRHFPLVLDQFFQGKEMEVDLVADGEDVFIPGIMEHIEPAGIHSGDSMAVFPSQVPPDIKERVIQYSEQIVRHFKYKGLLNIQLLWEKDQLYILEVNPRASRTVPIVSKVAGISLTDIAVKVIVGEQLTAVSELPEPEMKYVSVKYPLFSSHALPELDLLLGANMKSTGEGMCLGHTVEEALAKVFAALISKKKNSCLIEGQGCFEEWIQTNEAAVYFNDQVTEEAKEKRIQALKYGIMVISEATTFAAYLKAIKGNHAEPIPLPKEKTEGVIV